MAENVEVLLRLRGSRQFVSQATAAAMGVEKIGDSTEETGRKFDKAERSQSKFRSVMGRLAPIAMTGAAALAAAGGAAAAMGVKYNMGMEQTRVAFKQFLGSAGEADKMINRLKELNKSTPFEFPELAGTTKRLLAMGFSAEDAVKQTQILTDAVAGIGGGGAELDRASLAIGQIASKGKLSAEDLMQLTELGMVGMKDLAKQFNMSGSEFAKAMSKGEISSDEALKAINKVAKTNFGGAAAAQSKTFSGQLSNLKDAAGQLLGDAMMPLFTFLRDEALPALQTAMPTIAALAKVFGVTLVNAIKLVVQWGKFLIANWNTIKTIALALTPILAAIVTYQVILGFKALGVAIKAAAVASRAWAVSLMANPIVLIIAAVVALGVAFYVAYKKVAWFRNAVDATFQWIKNHWRLIVVLLAGPLGLAIVMVVNHWKELKKGAKPILDWLVGAVHTVTDAIKDLANWIGQLPWDKVGKAIGAAGKVAGGAADLGNKILGGKAMGGPVTRSGAYLVGERGPEVVSMRAGSHVFPTPAVAPVAGGLEGAREQTVVTKVYLNRRQIAEAVGAYTADMKARR